MSRENETFRLELEQLRLAFPNQAIINRTELQKYLCKSRNWCEAHGFCGKDYTLVKVAHTLSSLR